MARLCAVGEDGEFIINWSRAGHALVTHWSRTGHQLVAHWSRTGHQLDLKNAISVLLSVSGGWEPPKEPQTAQLTEQLMGRTTGSWMELPMVLLMQ